MPDLDALAQKYGAVSSPAAAGGPDLDALAQKHGAVSSTQGLAPGMSDDDIIRHYGFDPAVVKKAHLYSPGTFSGLYQFPLEQAFTLNDKEKPGAVQDVIHAAVVNPVMALAQLGSHAYSSLSNNPADGQFADVFAKVSKDAYQHWRGQPNKVAETVGTLLMPTPGSKLIKGSGVLASAGRGAIDGATIAAAQPVDVAPNGSYAAEKTKQTATGAVAGGATGAALGTVEKAVVKGANAPSTVMPEEAAASTAGNLESAMNNTRWGGVQDVIDAANNGDARAQKLLPQLQAKGGTPDEILQTSLRLSDFRTHQQSETLYDDVGKALAGNGLGSTNVPMSDTLAAINQSLAQAKAAKVPDQQLINWLETAKSNLASKTTTTASPVLNAAGQPIQTATTKSVDNSYGAIRRFRSDLDDEIRSGYNADNAAKFVPLLQRVRNAVESDLGRFTQTSAAPDVQQAARAADDYFQSVRIPMRDNMIAQARIDTEPDQIFDRFIKQGKGDRAQKFYDALDPKGQSAVRYQMAADAINAATDSVTGAFDPAKFAKSIDGVKDAYGVFFKGADKWQMDGVRNLMLQAARLDKLPLGKTALTAGAAAGNLAAVGMPHAAEAAGAISAATGVAKYLMMTDAGRKYLLAASSLKPGSAAMENLLVRARDYMARSASFGSTQTAAAPAQ